MTVQEYVKNARKAIEQIKDYTQEEVDRLAHESMEIVYQHADELLSIAFEETDLRTIVKTNSKELDAATMIRERLKEIESIRVNQVDFQKNAAKRVNTMDVVIAIVAFSDPIVTPLGAFINAIKGKCALIVCPDPRAKNTVADTVDFIQDALNKYNAPKDLIQVIDNPTLEQYIDLIPASDSIMFCGYQKSAES